MATDKEKLAVYFTGEERQDIDRWYQATDCRSRTEFIAEAVRFYIDYLKTGNAGTVLPAAIGSVIDGKLDTFENHMARLMFKQSVEMDMLLRMAADTQRLSDEYLQELRKDSIKAVRRTQGALTFDQVNREEQEAVWQS